MSYLSKDQLNDYLNNLNNQRASSTATKPDAPVPTTPSSHTDSNNSYQQAKKDLVYPMAAMSLKHDDLSPLRKPAQDAFEASLRVSSGAYTSRKQPPSPTPKSTALPAPAISNNKGDAGHSPTTRMPPAPARKPAHLSSTASPSSPITPTLPTSASSVPLATPPVHPGPENKKPAPLSSSLGQKVNVPNPLYSSTLCPQCQKPVSSGVIVSAMGKKWHKGCFTCSACRLPLDSVEYFEKDDKAYCSQDYRSLFHARCDYCHEPIHDTSIQALGKQYHVGHFFCHTCHVPFEEQGGFMVQDGQAYCEQDYLSSFGHQCKGCSQYIKGAFVNALGGDWHKDCFVCTECRQPFPNGTFHVRDDQPYCSKHVDAAKPSPAKTSAGSSDPSMCYTCRSSLADAKIIASAFGKNYHPHHFQCISCHTRLSSRVPGLWKNNGQDQVICLNCSK